MRVRGALVKLVHEGKVLHAPWSQREDIIDLKILPAGIPFGNPQPFLPIHNNRIDDLEKVPSITLYLPRLNRQGGQREIPISNIHQPFLPMQLDDQCHMLECTPISIIMQQTACNHGYLETA